MKIGISASRLAPAENTSSGDQITRPWYDCLGELDRLQQPVDHRRADEVQLGGDARDQHLAVERPDANVVVLEDLGARLSGAVALGADDAVAERLALVDRQRARRDEARVRGAARAFGPMHAGVAAAEAFEHPRRQRRGAERLAGVDVFLDPLRDLRPAGLLPELERPLARAEAPAHREVDVARALGDVGRGARRRSGSCRAGSPTGTAPADSSSRAAASGARPAASSGCARRSRRPCRRRRRSCRSPGRSAGCPCRPSCRSRRRSSGRARRRRAASAAPAASRSSAKNGSSCRAEVVLQRLDDVRHRVEADDVGGAEGARAGAAELLAGEVVDHVVGQAVGLGLLHRRQHAGDADAVGDEVGRVLARAPPTCRAPS